MKTFSFVSTNTFDLFLDGNDNDTWLQNVMEIFNLVNDIFHLIL